MATRIRRRFRPPVLSRLTWAWLIFALAAIAFSFYSVTAGRRAESPTRVALALGAEVENMARPLEQPPRTAPAAGAASVAAADLPSPALRDGEPGGEPFSTEGEDFLADASTSGAPYAEETLEVEAGDIVITIDGAPAPTPGARALTPEYASYAAPAASPIPAPDPALLQKTPFGDIPRIASDGRRAAAYYARPFKRGDNPRVAIIVGGLGLNSALTERAIDELPPEVTLAFAPYAKNLEHWTARAREAGHEIMIELPMEGYGGGADALGPAALTTGRTDSENLQRLDWLLARAGGYFGVTNYLGGKFSADRDAMASVLSRVRGLGLVYVDDTGAARQALTGDERIAIVNRLIAAGGGDGEIAGRDLAALEKIAARDGDALGKTYAYDTTITALGEWARDLEARKLTLAPASAVLQARSTGG
jgi:hypothetical protein